MTLLRIIIVTNLFLLRSYCLDSYTSCGEVDPLRQASAALIVNTFISPCVFNSVRSAIAEFW
jgi:hypothetical protein